ncbi:cytochrome oxidase subunit I [Aequorivita sp. H23M31]|uniref:Cytochrome oxidase subunit I n=1 Tax=Aequorivita ciconiae TaxID=2494375 RepID=A0A410G1V2_9FLAO|nr:cbb3-type cytochrome c oxidase subunit I [Aequorivita sp. H23M31]QAA81257.1 cytochrome oxidase subunit I [Aequorivita sp. H23M31]
MKKSKLLFYLLLVFTPVASFAQGAANNSEDWMFSPGVIGTFILLLIVLLISFFILFVKLNDYLNRLKSKKIHLSKLEFNEELWKLDSDEIDEVLEQRKNALSYKLKGNELGSENKAKDTKGLVQRVQKDPHNSFFAEKKKTPISIETPKELKNIVIYYLAASVFWLVFGTLVGEYLGLKFVWPDLDGAAGLSFGRLRPVHTNTVFWGWASLAMIGLGYFVVARTSNNKIFSYRNARIAWVLINLTVLFGNIALISGVNNGGGEYREYIWPIMILFMIALIITFHNFYKTVATRKISEIYIANWFMMASLLWTIVLSIIAYLPFYQDGMGETVAQGYYMHMGVGMWFMTFTLGLIYYYLPATLNKPIYSYSLGVLAFWTQMLFYTMIGTHHFIFSPLPWWLQTTAIVFSVGMVIPVVAGTTNFLMTMKGRFSHISRSYVLPFFLVGIVFYFVGSMQGSLQAFRFTNMVWHFNDFNVAHSHMTMYGIICFILWACIYTILPKLTGKEPPQLLVGTHFWFAFIGLFAYMMSLMVGGTLRGLSWIDGHPFLESVILMKPFWVWRAVGGTLMFISHLVFAYNFYYMVKKDKMIRPEPANIETVKGESINL